MKKLKLITLKNGAETVAVAELNDGYSHIISDDHCWVLINGRDGEAVWATHWFKEAVRELRDLPDRPDSYQPLTDVLASEEAYERLRKEREVAKVMES